MYIKNNLLLDFDVSNTNYFNDVTLELTSKSKWKNTKINNINLYDYGITQYDVGKTNSLLNNKILNIDDNKYLKLERIGKFDSNGIIDYSEYDLITLTGSTGNFLYSEGGYLNNVFKYHNYDIDYLPRVYGNGFTFETTLYIGNQTFEDINNNSNIFLYLGIRSEDKFASTYTGNTQYFTSESSNLYNSYYEYDISNIKENTQYIDKIYTYLETKFLYIKNGEQNIFYIDDNIDNNFTLILNNNILEKDIDYIFDERHKKIELNNINVSVEDILVINYYKKFDQTELVNINISEIENKINYQNFGLNNNVIAFKFNKDRKIGYRKIDQNNLIEEKYSDRSFNNLGWVHVLISFDPYNKISDFEIHDECYIIPRKGVLKFYINGNLFYKLDNFLEPSLNPLPINRTKQIGVPYNISWGGGSFGLKNSYNFNGNNFDYPYEKNSENDNLLIENNFDGYFKGGFQKLRIYDKALNLNEIRHNFNIESNLYNINSNKGGRIIYK